MKKSQPERLRHGFLHGFVPLQSTVCEGAVSENSRRGIAPPMGAM